MKYLITLINIIILVGCATQSQPTDTQDTLAANEGVLIFSTVEKEGATKYSGGGMRALNALVTLGLSEIDGNSYSLYFAEIDKRTQTLQNKKLGVGAAFYVKHDIKTEPLALTKQWHIIKVKEGSYVLKKINYILMGTPIRATKFSRNAVAVDIVAGQAYYLGDLTLGLAYSMAGANHGRQIYANMPSIEKHAWNKAQAAEVLVKYVNYPQTFVADKLVRTPFKK